MQDMVEIRRLRDLVTAQNETIQYALKAIEDMKRDMVEIRALAEKIVHHMAGL